MSVIALQSLPNQGVATPQWLADLLGGPLRKGGSYLLSGPPGLGKTTLLLQISAQAASTGLDVAFITTEQNADDLNQALSRISGHGWSALRHLKFYEAYGDTSLCGILEEATAADENLNPAMLVIDSVQGHGIASTLRSYREVFQLLETARRSRVSLLLASHITKSGAPAGPKSLEHNVDCLMSLNNLGRRCALGVHKNRFGAIPINDLVLERNASGRLVPAAATSPVTSTVIGFNGGITLIEAQARVAFSASALRRKLLTPTVPKPKLAHLLHLLRRAAVDVDEKLDEIRCYFPGERYRPEADLSLALAVAGSAKRFSVSQDIAFAGELDLHGCVRPLRREALQRFVFAALGSDVSQLVVAPATADIIGSMQPVDELPALRECFEILPVQTLKNTVDYFLRKGDPPISQNPLRGDEFNE